MHAPPASCLDHELWTRVLSLCPSLTLRARPFNCQQGDSPGQAPNPVRLSQPGMLRHSKSGTAAGPGSRPL